MTLPRAAALAALPWPLVLALRGTAAPLAWLGLMAGLTGIGWLVLHRRTASPALALALAPAAGLLLAAAAALITVRLERPLYPVFALAFAAAALAGLRRLGRERAVFAGRAVPGGPGLVAVAWLAAAVYLLPMARVDGVLRDGAYTWMDVDSTYDMAIAAGVRAFRMVYPGSATQDLGYHAGPYALGGLLAWAAHIEVSEAMAALKGAAQLALIGVAAGLGAAVRRMTGTGRRAPVWAACGALFLGAPPQVFAAHDFGPQAVWAAAALGVLAAGFLVRARRSPAARFAALAAGAAAVFALLYHLKPWYGTAGVPIRGFDIGLVHFGYAHSVLWGTLGLFLTAALVLDRLAAADEARPVADLLPLAALVLASNLFAGALALALAGAASLRRGFAWLRRAWAPGLAAFALLVVMVWALGMIHPNTPRRLDPTRPDWRAAEFASWIAWCGVWSGFACLAFRRLRAGAGGRRFSWALGAALAAAIALPILKAMPLPCTGNDNLLYPLYLMHPLISALALVALADLLREPAGPGPAAGPWSPGAAGTAAFLGLAVLVVALTPLRFTSRTAVSALAVILEAGRALALLVLAWALHRGGAAHPLFRRTFQGALLAFALLALYAGADRVAPYAGGVGRNTIAIPAAEYHVLRALRAAAGPHDVIATNRHSVPEKMPGRSFIYSALLERPVLMEGWGYSEVGDDPVTAFILRDNDRLFATTDPDEFRLLIRRYGIRFVLCQPGTDLALNPLPPWVRRLPGPDTIPVYAVVLP